MPRPLRAFVEGIYHISSHGSDARHLFLTAEDRTSFLDRLALVIERFRLRLVSYVLLGNHYHALLFTPGAVVSSALQQLHGWYSLTYNQRHGRSAHLSAPTASPARSRAMPTSSSPAGTSRGTRSRPG